MVRSSIKNLFPGVNPHLNSRLQLRNRWRDFHTAFIVDLRKTLMEKLYPMGYSTRLEDGIQIERLGEPPRYLRPDTVIIDPDPLRSETGFSGMVATTGEVVTPVLEMLTEEELDYFSAVAIRPLNTPDGKPVAWLELLSPTNKPPFSDFSDYQKKRAELLKTGLVYIEIDFLHQTLPTLSRIPSYPDRDPDSAPYCITVIDPRPDIETADGRSRLFKVEDKIPAMDIPLNDGDILKFDFGIPYLKTFEEAFYGTEIDYTSVPVNFETYSPADQAYIRQRMEAIAAMP